MEEEQSFFQKNKKDLIIIGIITVIFIIIITVIFILKNKTETKNVGGTLPNGSTGSSLYSKQNKSSNNNPNNEDNTSENQENINYYREGLINIWDKPVAGYYIYKKPNEFDDILLFVDSNTGYIYQKNLNEPTSTPTQITNTDLPNIREAYFVKINNQIKVMFQYSANNTTKSVMADIPDYYGATKELKNINNLDDNITNISPSPDFSKIIYVLTKNKTNNNKKDIVSDWFILDNNGKNKIYSSELSSWKLQITNYGEVYAYNNETAIEKSGLYKLDNNTKTLKNIYTGHFGSSYSINNNNILISTLTGSGLKLYKSDGFYNSYFSDNDLFEIKIKSLTNKCYLSETTICGVPKEILNYDSGLPDAWYQGLTSWDDNLFIINKDYPNGELLIDLKNEGEANETFDVKNVLISKDNERVLFINKNNGSLWSLYIGNITNQYIGD